MRLLLLGLVALASSAGAQDHSGHNTFIPIPPPQVEGQATPEAALAAAQARAVAARAPVRSAPRVAAVARSKRARRTVVEPPADRAPEPQAMQPLAPVAPALGSPVRQVPPAPRRVARRTLPRGVPRVSNVYRSAYLELLRLGDKRRQAGDVRGAAEAYAAVLQILPDNPAAMIALRSLEPR